jgi:alanine dehydrogenase
VASASEVFNGAEMVVEVKEILQSGTLIVDISCDTAGAIETSRTTNWSDPTYVVDGVRHFCVDNIPGAVPVTASAGYGEAILPKVRAIASLGLVAACRASPWLARGLTCANGGTPSCGSRPGAAVPLHTGGRLVAQTAAT